MSANDPKRTFPWPQSSVYTHIINGLKLLQRGHRKIVKGAAAGMFQSDLRLVLSHAPGLAFYRLHRPARDSRARLLSYGAGGVPLWPSFHSWWVSYFYIRILARKRSIRS